MRRFKGKICEVAECGKPAKYAIYKTLQNGEKEWWYVCVKHEEEIGRENFRRAGGRYTK